MNKPHSIPVLIVVTLFLAAACGGEDWQYLFDGKTLGGWTKRGGNAVYTVVDGAVVGTSAPNTPNTFLCTDKMYSDFVLELEYQVHPELNSGIQIRSNSFPDYKNGRVHGYQVEIDPSDRAFSSGIYDEARRGWLFDLKQNTAARYAFKHRDWNHVRIIAKGDRIVTYLNGVLAANLTDDKTSSGFIALQVHGVGGRKDPLDVRWRNIRLTENLADVELPPTQNPQMAFSGKIVESGTEIKKLADGFKFTEGPALGPDDRIYFSDIPDSRVHVFDLKTGEMAVYREDSGGTNGMMWTPNDALISCEGGRRGVSRHVIGGDYVTLVDQFEGKRLNSPNDLTLDNIGGIYFTDPRYGNRADMEMEIEGVYYIASGDKKLTRVIDDLVRPNGLVISNDFKKLYVADQAADKTYQYEIKRPGQLTNKQTFAPIGSDGMTIDDFGHVYLTHDQHVYVFSPDGREIDKIRFPENPANVTFGGPDRNIMFVTARAGFYSVQTNVTGSQARANP